MSLPGIFFVLAICFCFISLGWFVLVAAALRRDWRTSRDWVERVFTVLRVIPPLQLLSLFIPQIFVPEWGYRSIWFMFGYLTFIALTLIPYYYSRRREQQRFNKFRQEAKVLRQQLAQPLTIKLAATSEEYKGAGEIFANVFGQNFDQIFGRDRYSNGLLLSELLRLKEGEVYVALDGKHNVVGAMWLDLGDKNAHTPTFKQLWPILRRYLDQFNALYGAIVGVPAMMAKTGTAKTAYIHWLGVAVKAQGQGIATMLLTLAQEKACQAGNKEISLHTESSNKIARGLYTRFGMHETFNLHLTPQVHYVKKVEANVKLAGVEQQKQGESSR